MVSPPRLSERVDTDHMEKIPDDAEKKTTLATSLMHCVLNEHFRTRKASVDVSCAADATVSGELSLAVMASSTASGTLPGSLRRVLAAIRDSDERRRHGRGRRRRVTATTTATTVCPRPPNASILVITGFRTARCRPPTSKSAGSPWPRPRRRDLTMKDICR